MPVVTRARAKGNGNGNPVESVAPSNTQAEPSGKPLTRAMTQKQCSPSTASTASSHSHSSQQLKNKNSSSSRNEAVVENVISKRVGRTNTVELNDEERKPAPEKGTKKVRWCSTEPAMVVFI